ncbi:MAG TPA: hypothetical protein VJ912_00270 [Candidatus Nanoarchaeia archaeon]|nr:hypothetical protein [Candidatus Nanoarchaeia archaeon]
MKRDLFEKYIEYNPDSDLEGSGERDFGHQLAEAMMKNNNYNPEKVPKLTKQGGLEKNTKKVIFSSEEQRRVNLHYINRIKNKYFNNN